jgi:hypothetical protein
MSKFLLNLLVQISKALVYLKNQILFGKEFSPSLSAHPAFRPSLFFLLADFPSPPLLGLGLLAGPAHRTAQPATFFLLPHRRRARKALPPAGLAPPPRSPRRLHRKETNRHINPHHFPHYSMPFPLFNNR